MHITDCTWARACVCGGVLKELRKKPKWDLSEEKATHGIVNLPAFLHCLCAVPDYVPVVSLAVPTTNKGSLAPRCSPSLVCLPAGYARFAS
eukprot:scaffold7748_cov33-Tisochrysis_lutea.AAC.2